MEFQQPSIYLEEMEKFNKEGLKEIRRKTIRPFLEELNRINGESRIKINYSTNEILIKSGFGKAIEESDIRKLARFEKQFMTGMCKGSEDTRRQICKDTLVLFQQDHQCPFCTTDKEKTTPHAEEGPKDCSQATIMEDSSSNTSNKTFNEPDSADS